MKECPNCYDNIPDSARLCPNCGNIFDDIDEHYERNESYIIICPVDGRIFNVPDINSRINGCCDTCGYDLSNEVPVVRIDNELCIYLERMKNKKRYPIYAEEKVTLGRDVQGEINKECFPSDDIEFSRNECVIEYVNGIWRIYTENTHGKLLINGENIPLGVHRNINDNDIITINKCRFRVVF